MSTANDTHSFNTILDSRNEILQLMGGLRQIEPIKSEFLLVDFNDFSIKKVRLTDHERQCFDNSLLYLVFSYNKVSVIEIFRLKMYSLGIELFLPTEDITRIVCIWIAWARFMPMSTAFSLLNLDISAIFSSISSKSTTVS